MVPEGWEVRTLGEIAIVTSGGTPSRSNPSYWNGGDIPWARTTEVQNCVIQKSDIGEFITKAGLRNSSAKMIPANSILLALIGQGKTRGQVALLANESAVNQNCAAIILDKSHNPVYYFNYLLSQYQNIRNLSNSAGQSNLSGALVKSIRVPVPPPDEQKQITRILSTWDKAIETVEKLIENSKAQKKSLMQQLLTGKQRFLGFSKEWPEVALGGLGTTYGGLSGKSKEDFGRGKPFIPYVNIFNNSKVDLAHLDFVDISPTEKQSCARYGDIFFTTSSETPEEVGMSSILLDQVSDLYLNSFCFGFRLHNFDTLSPEYARYVLRSEQVRRMIAVLAQGSTRFNLSKKALMKIKLKLPCVEEQKTITEVLVNAEEQIKALEQQRLRLQEQKKALMQQLLTGKRRVKVDEP